jgi:predicted TIM-barrel fold metal-dependent hydrolase
MSMMRLVLSGIFDTYPGLKIILGHLGEALPFLLARMDYPYVIPWFDRATIPHLEKKPSDYFKNNVFVTANSARNGLSLRRSKGMHAVFRGTIFISRR